MFVCASCSEQQERRALDADGVPLEAARPAGPALEGHREGAYVRLRPLRASGQRAPRRSVLFCAFNFSFASIHITSITLTSTKRHIELCVAFTFVTNQSPSLSLPFSLLIPFFYALPFLLHRLVTNRCIVCDLNCAMNCVMTIANFL